MRKRLLLCLLPLLFAFFTACDYHELTNTVLAVGLGIQYTDDEEYLVSVEIITMEKGTLETYQPQIAKSTGKTLLEAASNIRGLIARKLDFSHCQVILFDEKVAQQGLENAIEALVETDEISINTFCMITVGATPLEVLSSEPLSTRAQSLELRATLVDAVGLQSASKVSVLSLHNDLYDNGEAGILPLAERIVEGNKSLVDIRGGVALEADRMAGILTREEVSFYMLAVGGVRQRILSVPFGDRYISVQFVHGTGKVEPRLTPEGIEVSVSMNAKINLISQLPEDNPDSRELLQKISAFVRQGIEALTTRARDELDCDLFRVAGKLYRRYPSLQPDLSGWRESVRTATYRVQVSLDLQTDEIFGEGHQTWKKTR